MSNTDYQTQAYLKSVGYDSLDDYIADKGVGSDVGVAHLDLKGMGFPTAAPAPAWNQYFREAERSGKTLGELGALYGASSPLFSNDYVNYRFGVPTDAVFTGLSGSGNAMMTRAGGEALGTGYAWTGNAMNPLEYKDSQSAGVSTPLFKQMTKLYGNDYANETGYYLPQSLLDPYYKKMDEYSFDQASLAGLPSDLGTRLKDKALYSDIPGMGKGFIFPTWQSYLDTFGDTSVGSQGTGRFGTNYKYYRATGDEGNQIRNAREDAQGGGFNLGSLAPLLSIAGAAFGVPMLGQIASGLSLGTGLATGNIGQALSGGVGMLPGLDLGAGAIGDALSSVSGATGIPIDALSAGLKAGTLSAIQGKDIGDVATSALVGGVGGSKFGHTEGLTPTDVAQGEGGWWDDLRSLGLSSNAIASIQSGGIGGLQAALTGEDFIKSALSSGLSTYVGKEIDDLDLTKKGSYIDKYAPLTASAITKDFVDTGGKNVGKILKNAAIAGASDYTANTASAGVKTLGGAIKDAVVGTGIASSNDTGNGEGESLAEDTNSASDPLGAIADATGIASSNDTGNGEGESLGGSVESGWIDKFRDQLDTKLAEWEDKWPDKLIDWAAQKTKALVKQGVKQTLAEALVEEEIAPQRVALRAKDAKAKSDKAKSDKAKADKSKDDKVKADKAWNTHAHNQREWQKGLRQAGRKGVEDAEARKRKALESPTESPLQQAMYMLQMPEHMAYLDDMTELG